MDVNELLAKKGIEDKIINDSSFSAKEASIKEVFEEHNCVLGKNIFKEPVIRYPWKIDGKVNWKNLIIGGSWGKFLGMIVFCAFLLLASAAYNHDVDYYKSVIDCYRNPPNIKNVTAYNECQKIILDYEIRIGLKDAYGNVINETGMKKFI